MNRQISTWHCVCRSSCGLHAQFVHARHLLGYVNSLLSSICLPLYNLWCLQKHLYQQDILLCFYGLLQLPSAEEFSDGEKRKPKWFWVLDMILLKRLVSYSFCQESIQYIFKWINNRKSFFCFTNTSSSQAYETGNRLLYCHPNQVTWLTMYIPVHYLHCQ